MLVNLKSFELHRLELPSGRRFGDCSCWCDTLDIVALCLESNQSHRGWGFGQTISKGVFTRPAPYIVPMPSLAEMRADFERTVWPVLNGRNPFALILHRPALFSAYTIVDQAIRMGLWDLMAQSVELPLYQFLGAPPQNNSVRTYGSGLDFPLSDEDAVAQYRRFIDMGFNFSKRAFAPSAAVHW